MAPKRCNSRTAQLVNKRLRKNEEGLREMHDNMKRNNICIIGIPEGEEEEQEIQNLSEKVMMENFPNLMREIIKQIQEMKRVPNTRNPKDPLQDTLSLKWQNSKTKTGS